MGNIPLCVPKKGPVVFTEGYDILSRAQPVPMKQYYPYHSSLEDLSRTEYEPDLEAASQYYREDKRHSFFIGDDPAIIGLEIDQDSDQVYSGLLQFQYFNGNETETQNIHVKSSDTVADLIPTLRATFLKRSSEQTEDNGEGEEGSHNYVALVQGEMERELDVVDKPLEIALDCSSKGLASPKFVFKSPLSEQTDTPLSPRQTSRFTSYVGPLMMPSGSSENEDSPSYAKRLTTEFDQMSMNSYGSALSLSSKSSSKTKSTSSLVTKSKKKKLAHTLSNQETGTTRLQDQEPSPSHHHSSSHLHIESPSSKRKSNGRPKSIMSNFITRSLRVRKKNKQSTETPPTTDPTEDVDSGCLPQVASEGCMGISSLVSPLPAERRFTLSAVMHIYYMKPKQVQLYKSVLVSDTSTTRQVISQALERYNMKLFNPEDFGLYEVIGKWQEISSTLPSRQSHPNATNPAFSTLPNKPTTSPLVNRRTAVEEFIVCYSRKLDMDECPYSAQYFLDTKEGYTRRFELRKLLPEFDENRKKSIASASMVEGACLSRKSESPVQADQRSVSIPHIDSTPEPTPVIFGQTTHRKRARRLRASADAAKKSHKDEQAREVTRVLITGPSSDDEQISGDVSILNCSSPESDTSHSGMDSALGNHNVHMASLSRPFLLNVRILDPGREELVRFLTRDTTVMAVKPNITSHKETTPSSESEIHLSSPDFDEPTPLCSICQHPVPDSNCFTVTPRTEAVSILVNGHCIQKSTPLNHGDILSIGGRQMLLFQHFSSHVKGYSWEPRPLDSTLKAANQELFRPSSQMSTSSTSTNGEEHGKLTIKSAALRSNSRSGSEISLTVEDVDSHTITAINIEEEDPVMMITKPDSDAQSKHSAHTRLIMKQMLESEGPDREDPGPSCSERVDSQADDSHPPPSSSSSLHSKQTLKQSTSLPPHPTARKVMFSYSLTEEDALLAVLINQFVSGRVTVPLGPAYALSMCTEYGMMCYGPRAMTAFVKKAVGQIQNKAWETCKHLAALQVDAEKAKKPLSIMKELFARLETVLVLLANTLEFYHFLTTSCQSLNLLHSSPQKKSRQDQEQSSEDVLLGFQNVLVYTFQQAFYSISRVLYHALPVMLDGCAEDKLRGKIGKPIVLDQAVDFLQSLFDLLTKLHVHLEVTSQFFANIFFFTNAVMFNALIEQGGDLALYQHSSGQALRANLNLLEGWACQVGFRDSVLHYLAKFSGAVDLLATQPAQLLEMDWSCLRKEYPMLHPAQLHYVLSSYLLPVSHLPSHWTPPQDDAIHAVKTDALSESFDHHPAFELPTSGYLVDLTKPPHNMEQLQTYLDELRKQLKDPQRSVDIVPVTESKPLTAPYMNGESSDSVHTLANSKPHLKRTLLINDSPVRARRNIGSNTESQEDLLQDARNTRNSKHHDNIILEDCKQNGGNTHSTVKANGEVKKTPLRKTGREKIIERVHSIVGPRSFKTPEKFLLEPDDSLWLDTNFPLNAETVTIPRGDKGFGFIMVEKKEPGATVPTIFIDEILPGSTADECALVKGGDKILAIDGQLLDGADYIIADKYLKEAEDDVTLVISR